MDISKQSTYNYTVGEIINIVEQSLSSEDNDFQDLEADIFICPPESNISTDEDSADEDEGGAIDNLSSRQLAATAEIRFTPRQEDREEFLSYKATAKRSWVDGDLECLNNSSQFCKEYYKKYSNFTPVDFFELFFDENMLNHLLEETENYASFKNCQNPSVKYEELKCFLGILILSGYNKLPGKKFYWDKNDDMHNKMVVDAMPRDRFIQIIQFIHAADNTKINADDKLWKLRPVIDIFKKNILDNFVPYEFLGYDEIMIKYFGNHGPKQLFRGKSIKFGYKAWCLNTDFGYLIDFDIYQGNNPERITAHEAAFGKCAAPLIGMLNNLPKKPYNLFLDNLFTGINLLNYLKKEGIGCTGTLRSNRLPKDCPITSESEMEKKKRGTFQKAIEREDGIFVCRWMDTSVVTIASTAHGVAPINQVKRYSSKEKRIINVPQPSAFQQYNKHIGGTNRMEQDTNMYRISIRGKKWWWPIFTWLIDVAMNNAWLLYRKSVKNITKLEFRRRVAQTYCTRYKNPGKSAGGMSHSSSIEKRVNPDLRYDRLDHLVEPTDNNKRRRCAGEHCKSVVRTKCGKCDVGLCIFCFSEFHKK